MKRFFSFLAAAAMLFAASCAEDTVGTDNGNEAQVTFNLGLEGQSATRAIADGMTVTDMYYQVFDEKGTPLKLTETPQHKPGVFNASNRTATINLQLAKGQKYKLVVWAQHKDAPYSVENGMVVKADYTNVVSNNENLDAFCAVHEYDPEKNNTDVILKRPFAQLNVGVTENDWNAAVNSNVNISHSKVVISKVYNTFDIFNNEFSDVSENVTFAMNARPADQTLDVELNGQEGIQDDEKFYYLSMNYLMIGEKMDIGAKFCFETGDGKHVDFELATIPVERNHRTNIVGQILTGTLDFNVKIDAGFAENNKYGAIDGKVYVRVKTAQEFNEAFVDNKIDLIILDDDIQLSETLTRATTDYTLTVSSGKDLVIDLNGKKLSSTSTATGKNYNMFDVRGTLTVKNGTMEYKHVGQNMEWNNSTNLFNVTAGGVLNIEGVTAKNLGGSDMAFVAHLNNWGEVTLNVNNSTLESPYVAVRVFNSGNDMNNVTIKNSNLTGGSSAFWVHNYTLEDFGGSQEKVDAHKALLNFDIYDQGNTFSPDLNGIRYGFTNEIRTDAYGITKTVSEDGSEVTLGSIVENGIIRRGVAGTEENTTITKAVIEDGVTTLYDRTFRRFYALETVVLPSTLTTIGATGSGVFQSCTSLKNIIIPESVTVLGKGAFQECSALESINIPVGVTRIEENALRATGLKKVEFHSGVTYFGAQAFRDCKQLKEVIINAPSFTVEANAFGVMAGTLPGTKIYVVNAEMKAYLESTLTYANQFTIIAPEEANSNETLKNALEEGSMMVNVAAGEYTLPSSSIKEGQTIICEEGTVFTGKSSLNIKGATIIGATFSNTSDNAVGGTINGTFKNCKFEGNNALRYCYSGETVVFENCEFSGSVYGVHFDGGTDGSANEVIFRNCTFSGFNAMGAAISMVTFEGCTFKGNGKSGYNGINLWGSAKMVNCEFTFDGTTANEWIDCIGADKTYEFVNCTINGTPYTSENCTDYEDIFSRNNVSVKINGVDCQI